MFRVWDVYAVYAAVRRTGKTLYLVDCIETMLGSRQMCEAIDLEELVEKV